MRIKNSIKARYYSMSYYTYIGDNLKHEFIDIISDICYYKNGKKDGDYILWYENGELNKHLHYKNDKLNGECILYNAHFNYGTIYMKCNYIDDKIVNEII